MANYIRYGLQSNRPDTSNEIRYYLKQGPIITGCPVVQMSLRGHHARSYNYRA